MFSGLEVGLTEITFTLCTFTLSLYIVCFVSSDNI